MLTYNSRILARCSLCELKRCGYACGSELAAVCQPNMRPRLQPYRGNDTVLLKVHEKAIADLTWCTSFSKSHEASLGGCRGSTFAFTSHSAASCRQTESKSHENSYFALFIDNTRALVHIKPQAEWLVGQHNAHKEKRAVNRALNFGSPVGCEMCAGVMYAHAILHLPPALLHAGWDATLIASDSQSRQQPKQTPSQGANTGAYQERPAEDARALRPGAGKKLRAKLRLVATEHLEHCIALQQRQSAGALAFAQSAVHHAYVHVACRVRQKARTLIHLCVTHLYC